MLDVNVVETGAAGPLGGISIKVRVTSSLPVTCIAWVCARGLASLASLFWVSVAKENCRAVLGLSVQNISLGPPSCQVLILITTCLCLMSVFWQVTGLNQAMGQSLFNIDWFHSHGKSCCEHQGEWVATLHVFGGGSAGCRERDWLLRLGLGWVGWLCWVRGRRQQVRHAGPRHGRLTRARLWPVHTSAPLFCNNILFPHS